MIEFNTICVDSSLQETTHTVEMNGKIYVISHGGVFKYAEFMEWIYRVMCSGSTSKVALKKAVSEEHKTLMTGEAIQHLNTKSLIPQDIVDIINSLGDYHHL